MEISDVHEAHECEVSWLAVSKITTNEVTAFLSFLFGQYQVMMREKGRVFETVEALG